MNNADGAEEPGMRLRGALTTSIYNTAVADFDRGCIRIDDADVNGDGSVIVPSDVALTNVITECAGGLYTHEVADTPVNVTEGTVTTDAAYALTDAAASVTAITPVATDNGSGFAFEETDYVGAVAPGTSAEDAWWAGWIIEGSLD